jgi:hypothetical protein
LSRIIVEDFLKSSWPCVQALVTDLGTFKTENRAKVPLYYFGNGQQKDLTFDGDHFFLRASVEYSNPQLTVEEVQGIIAARLLEVCGNYCYERGASQCGQREIDEICQILDDPPTGKIVTFLLNTDDIEPDRYSMNPLKESILNSGQSAFPAASVKTEKLQIDQKFVQKYDGSLISKGEIERIAYHLGSCDNNNYMDMIDKVKYEHLERLSDSFGINLCLPSMRLPINTLKKETTEGLLHYILRETHKDYASIECVYTCMGRSMKNLRTLLTIPQSTKGYGSKRAAKGRIYFDGSKLEKIKVNYRTVQLYPNAIDPNDVSEARAEDSFEMEGDRFVNYSFKETPSSPQFFLYSLASPEDAVLWHGIGAFGASELLKSYTTTRLACMKSLLVKDLKERYGVALRLPLQFNLVPAYMWVHPLHRNIDASIGCVENLKDIAAQGMRIEHLPTNKYIR